MPDNSTPDQPHQPAATPVPPDVEKLAESDDAALVSARAELLEAQAALVKANSSPWDKLMIRFVLPIALAIVGPWAAYTFSVEAQEAKAKAEEGIKEVGELQTLLKQQKENADRQRERFREIEEEKAAELTAMSNMVTRLDNTLKLALVQMAVAQMLAKAPSTPKTMPGVNPVPLAPREIPDRETVIRDVAAQVQLPGLDEDEVERLAGQQYDRIMEQRTR
jgi:hypothetical protein